MFERFTHEARAIVTRAQAEASALGHDNIGTEHLLLALAAEWGDAPRMLGVDREALRREVVAMGREDPGRLDADALATIGIDLDEVRRRVEASFGPGALGRRHRTCARGRVLDHRPFTPRATKALELSLREALALGHRHIGAGHAALGVVRDRDSGAARALERCGTHPDRVRTAVLALLRPAA
jgi:ATP-dependent Clp protease ATP-binding subunit ClpA